MNIHIETERLILRDLELSDAEGMFALDSDPAVHEYLGKKTIKAIEESIKIIQHVRGQYQENGIGRWAVIDKATQDFAGWSGLKLEKNIRDFNYYDLGYRFRKEYWGKGIGTESAIASLKYGFTQLNLNEICALADVDNIGSNKILQKVGLQLVETFDFEGTPCNWYKITKSDWLTQAQTTQAS